MTNTLKVTEFSAAVRGYHYYGSIWFPEKEEQLDCSHDFGNVFDVFAIKTCKPDGTVKLVHPNMKLSSGLFLKNRLLQPNQQTKREIHRTLTIQRKNRSQITT